MFNHEILKPPDSDLGNNQNTSFFYSVMIGLFGTGSLDKGYCNVRKKLRGQFDTSVTLSFDFRKRIRIQVFYLLLCATSSTRYSFVVGTLLPNFCYAAYVTQKFVAKTQC